MRVTFSSSRRAWRAKQPCRAATCRGLFALGAVAAMLAAGVPAVAQTATATDARGEYARGRVLVTARAGLSDIELGKIVGVHGGRARAIGRTGVFIVDLPSQASETAVMQQLARHPHLKSAELDRKVSPAMATNDPYLGSAWHLQKIGALGAWDTTLGGGITIAILDTGVDGTHPDLMANMVPGWNAFNNNTNTADFMGHGTAVAGAAAAVSNNGIGVASVAGQAKLMPIVVTDSSGGAFYSVIAQGITYAADHGARVASCSFSGLVPSSAIQSAAQYMRGKGGLVVVAAGNTGAVDNVAPTTAMIPVSATLSDDSRASWSTYGAFVAMSAPGDNIYSTGRGGVYGSYWGTSLATPIVSATVALMMAAKPALTGAEVETLLFATATDLGAAGRDPYYGYGRVNAGAAVAAALAATPGGNATDTVAPSVAIAAPLAGSTVGGLVPVNVNASDNVGVSRVELRVNGALVATDTASPYAFSWDSALSANGNATLTVAAYDAAGNAATSAPVSVNVYNTPPIDTADKIAPTVSITSPITAGTLSGTVTVSTSASDNSGAAGITQTLYIDGALKATATGASLVYRWNTRKVAPGVHTLRVVARDAAGNSSATSTNVSK